MNRILTNRDAVVVLQLFLLGRLTVDEGAVGAPQVNDPELIAATLHASVVPTGRRVTENQVVVGRASHAQRVLGGTISVPSIGT